MLQQERQNGCPGKLPSCASQRPLRQCAVGKCTGMPTAVQKASGRPCPASGSSARHHKGPGSTAYFQTSYTRRPLGPAATPAPVAARRSRALPSRAVRQCVAAAWQPARYCRPVAPGSFRPSSAPRNLLPLRVCVSCLWCVACRWCSGAGRRAAAGGSAQQGKVLQCALWRVRCARTGMGNSTAGPTTPEGGADAARLQNAQKPGFHPPARSASHARRARPYRAP